ncbi:hypothetical protein [Sediminibacillus albus]|uniref:DUF3967 domain-containing protein n=1 Tax=Sediminibacillus albus TaxID=407036 RepID=A0A1G9A281_9BACI|nr:hypothetical protein [Sediminibacillus albus]SDK20490.1 hypothetical protein SAMN05216243_2315 [Sediminibacillus albus]
MDLKDRNEPNEIIEQYLSQSVTEITYEEERPEAAVTSIIKSYESILAEVKGQRDLLQQLYEDSQQQNKMLMAQMQENTKILSEFKNSISSDNEEQQTKVEELKNLIEKDKANREEEKSTVEQRDKELMKMLRQLSENKENQQEKPWYKKIFK